MLISTPDFFTANFLLKGEIIETSPTVPHVMPSQVHGKEILVVDEKTQGVFLPSRPEADGVLLTVPGVQASLRFADCAPVMIWGSDWVMILHSGYKGTVLGISREGLRLVGKKSSSEAFAWIGPCIGREYFRKSDDEWTLRGIESFHRENFYVKGGNVYFDLAGEIRSQLLDEGLNDERIVLSGIDTLKDERCYSYRKGDVNERMRMIVRT